MKFKRLAIMMVAVVGLAACSQDTAVKEEIIDVKEMVKGYSVGTLDAESASITGEQLIVVEDGKEKKYDLPEDEFFVSIAPYVNETHPCQIHSLVGCQGELTEAEFDVRIEDESGKVIIDEKMKSLDNGFIDIWLPRGHNFQVEISHDGKVAAAELATFKDDQTCITTMQLQ